MKVQWAVPVLASILILGTLLPAITLGDASATHFRGVDASAEIKIKTKKATAECTEASGESCGEGKMKSKFRLLVQNVDGDTVTGIAKGKIQVKIVSDPGTGVIKDQFRSNNLQFEMNTLHGSDSQLRLTGIVKDKNGNNWDLVVTGGNITPNDDGTFIIDLNIELTGEDGRVVCGANHGNSIVIDHTSEG